MSDDLRLALHVPVLQVVVPVEPGEVKLLDMPIAYARASLPRDMRVRYEVGTLEPRLAIYRRDPPAPEETVAFLTPHQIAMIVAFWKEHGVELPGVTDKLALALEALREISKGEGIYKRDPFEHASNTIDNMKALALAAIAALEP